MKSWKKENSLPDSHQVQKISHTLGFSAGCNELIKVRCKNFGWLTSLVMVMASTPALSAEYSDKQILPNIEEVFFTDEAIGFIGTKTYYPKKSDKPYFILYRDKSVGQEVDFPVFQSVFPAHTDKAPVTKEDRYTLVTSDGYSYEVTNQDLGCAWAPTASEYKIPVTNPQHDQTNQTMKLGDEIIQTHVHTCNVITAVEHVGDRLWIGTGFNGDHGLHAGQGIVIQNRKTEKLELTLSELEAWTNKIRLDPYSEDVWAASSHIINRIAPDGELVSKYYFFKEFDLSTGKPRYFLSSKPEKTNPLAVIADLMTVENAKALSRLSQAIPKEDANTFSLYNFFMCCGTRQNEFYLESMNEMVPLIINELAILDEKLALLDGAYDSEVSILKERWIQALCRFNDPQVLPFIRRIATRETKNPVRLLNACIEKLKPKGIPW